FALDKADACGPDRTHEGHAGNGQRSAGRDHGDHVCLGLAVIRQHLADYVDFVVEPLWKQRPYRPVDQAAGQRFLLGSSALALEEAARDTPGGRKLFLVVDSEREEILPLLDALGRRDST